MGILQFIRKIFGATEKTDQQAEKTENPSDRFIRMMEMLASTREEELSCDEVFEMLDQFVELAVKGEDVRRLMPLVQHHLDMCDDCREEYQYLERILNGLGGE